MENEKSSRNLTGSTGEQNPVSVNGNYNTVNVTVNVDSKAFECKTNSDAQTVKDVIEGIIHLVGVGISSYTRKESQQPPQPIIKKTQKKK